MTIIFSNYVIANSKKCTYLTQGRHVCGAPDLVQVVMGISGEVFVLPAAPIDEAHPG